MALQSFEEFNDEIGEMEKDKKTAMIEGYSWKQIKNELQKEQHLVNEILNELNFFSNAQSFGPPNNNETIDHFKQNNKPQKSIQHRYGSHTDNTKRSSLRNVCNKNISIHQSIDLFAS